MNDKLSKEEIEALRASDGAAPAEPVDIGANAEAHTAAEILAVVGSGEAERCDERRRQLGALLGHL